MNIFLYNNPNNLKLKDDGNLVLNGKGPLYANGRTSLKWFLKAVDTSFYA